MRIEQPYHPGELQVQQQAGEALTARGNGQVIADTILGGALRFIEQQPFVVAGSIDRQQQVWASLIFGEPGFVRATDPQTVVIQATPDDDPFWANLEHTPAVGLLLIELMSRRRLRINGRSTRTPTGLTLGVTASYPNCPKYIQRRQPTRTNRPAVPPLGTRQGDRLELAQQTLIAAADTLFVASAHPSQGVDASHRGGETGVRAGPRRADAPRARLSR
ncbi:pyridoxamine 5'-phosphate oxidase family protein [Candidatus Cyanaurora vandensis]|uniref:pyridoxamine 5'-phosphate oxidase family protein n=1 Tax=Candidatus Cyanaurora vandensis TaxID=2714958 RepID=UPI00257D32DA|nr:pyridoxamine 5'-phosphate oxidase family protein [Candidatus Cyanaurora vandensis]